MSGDLSFEIPELGENGKIDRAVDFLNDNFDILVDEMDPGKTYITDKTDGNPISFDEIYLTLKNRNFNIGRSDLFTILRVPKYFKKVNIVKNYLETMQGKYKGESHIDLLCSYITARDFGDKEPGYYTNRMKNLIRKWLVASAACSLGYHVNDVVLVFIDDEGVGKTSLTRYLWPKQLINHCQVLTQDTNKFNFPELFSRKFIVVFDELVGINHRRPEEFKQIMSTQDCMIYFPHDPFPRTVPRTANALGTSNKNQEKGGFITNDLGLRRFGSIELSKIDWRGYSKVVDTDQIWAEVMMLISQDFNYVFDETDWEEFKNYNRRFMIETIQTKVLRTHYSIPDPDETRTEFYMSATDVYNDIIKRKLCRKEDMFKLTVSNIGSALTHLEFPQKAIRKKSGSGNPAYMYHIKFFN